MTPTLCVRHAHWRDLHRKQYYVNMVAKAKLDIGHSHN